MSAVTWALILAGVTLNAAAQLLLKVATRPLAHLSGFDLTALSFSIRVLFGSVFFWAGMVCYAVSVCVWLRRLSKAPVSTAYPMLSLGYVMVAAVSVTLWARPCRLGKLLGILLICAGVVLTSRYST